ncbi:hypothetical protein F5X68DRAFT_72381 [Plectosphaerella plurivora]|uniref:Uncharacterized protein n=1 Tax=Plectosphaerella plurivora TaxID=936078 RepID=A0A9P9ACM1_9PEZI|nr:hypothetical protein F5X68DRAFT_72381 [Plectosphaerella plurivora]
MQRNAMPFFFFFCCSTGLAIAVGAANRPPPSHFSFRHRLASSVRRPVSSPPHDLGGACLRAAFGPRVNTSAPQTSNHAAHISFNHFAGRDKNNFATQVTIAILQKVMAGKRHVISTARSHVVASQTHALIPTVPDQYVARWAHRVRLSANLAPPSPLSPPPDIKKTRDHLARATAGRPAGRGCCWAAASSRKLSPAPSSPRSSTRTCQLSRLRPVDYHPPVRLAL